MVRLDDVVIRVTAEPCKMLCLEEVIAMGVF
jgi:hypothetical protein